MKLEKLREIANDYKTFKELPCPSCSLEPERTHDSIPCYCTDLMDKKQALDEVAANHFDALLDVVDAVKSSLDGQHEWLETYCDAGAPDDCDHCVIVGALAKLEAVE